MLINTAWLLDYLTPHPTHRDLLDAFTPAGLEVEESHELAVALRGVVIGFIRDVQPLAGAAGMYHTQIEVAKDRVVDVVCASEHEVRVGWGIPVATAGTVLPSGVEIKAAKYHGVDSAGMICLDGELGLIARGSGLQEFEDESLLGRPLPEVSPIDEYLVELSILPNRGDCLGMIGIAREIAAVLGLTLKYPVPPPPLVPKLQLGNESPKSVVPVTIEEPQLCPRYLGQSIRGVKVGPSPHWLKSRLLAAGKRPISNVVDVTNFVLLEWGQPLHAFDLSTLQGGEIRVRKMKKGETLELLDGTELKGDTQPLVIADGKRPVALAGIMGGAATQTRGETTDVLLEAACFDPVTIRHTSRQLGVRTDSSYRFERGTDPNRMLIGAATRAAELIVELTGGQLDGDCTEQYPSPKSPRQFQVTTQQFSGLLGMPVDAAMIRDNLVKLEMECDDKLNVAVPTWRYDATDPVALIEDVARLVGYDAVPLQPQSSADTSGHTHPLDRLRKTIAETLVANGFLECRTPPLVGEDPADTFAAGVAPIRLTNPMRADMAELRRSLLPSVLEVVERNARRGAESFRYFEIDRTFCHDPEGPIETWSVGLIAGGPINDRSWQQAGDLLDFYRVKGIVENLLEAAGVASAVFEPTHSAIRNPQSAIAGFVPGKTAVIKAEGREVGILGAVDPKLVAKSKLRTPLFAAELNLELLTGHYSEIRLHRGLPRTPAVSRDLALILPVGKTFAEIEATVRHAFTKAADSVHADYIETSEEGAAEDLLPPRLEQFGCIDEYRGKPIPEDRKSLAVRLTFRDIARTLTSEESTRLTDAVVAALKHEHSAELRG
jgi:phenylalanyl-tRNA synthetase beta chain